MPPRRLFGFLDVIAYLLALASLGALLWTGGRAWYESVRLAQWNLLVHVASGGLFLLSSVVLVVRVADACRLERFPRRAKPHYAGAGREYAPWSSDVRPAQRALFWLIVAAWLVTSGSVLSTMTPIMGYSLATRMIVVHRYAGFALVILMGLHLVVGVLPKRWR
jgi:cytochrome b subunit of formate dehydrogenase